jgi:glutamyl-tRNA reductase
MGIAVMGVSHKTAPVELREHLALAPERLAAALGRLKSASALQESVILSTCNRFEVYVRPSASAADALIAVEDFFAGLYDHPRLLASTYQFRSFDAARHLFRVASGLDSMVVGETEILGQVKSAYLEAQKNGTTGKITNVMFQRALFVGKHVRNQTSISEGSTSVGSTAVQLAERIFGPLNGHRLLLVGAGKMAEITARHLLSQKTGEIVVLNRTLERAAELAALLNGRHGSIERLGDELEAADIVICSTSAERAVVSSDMVQAIMKKRRGRSLYFIDISVPRNVAPDVNAIDNVYVYNIDDLRALVESGLEQRRGAVNQAEQMVDGLAKEFYEWVSAAIEGRDRPLRHQRVL